MSAFKITEFSSTLYTVEHDRTAYPHPLWLSWWDANGFAEEGWYLETATGGIGHEVGGPFDDPEGDDAHERIRSFLHVHAKVPA